MDRPAKPTIMSSVARLTLNVILRREGTELCGVFYGPGFRPRQSSIFAASTSIIGISS